MLESKAYRESVFNITQEKNGIVYVINTLTKSIVQVGKKEWKTIEPMLRSAICDNTSEGKKYFSDLIQYGFIVDARYDECKQLEYAYWQNTFDNTRLTIGFIPTFKCNFGCPYCYEEIKESTISEKNLQVFKIFLKNKLPQFKMVLFNIFGGEALTRWDILEDILAFNIQLQKEYGFDYSGHIATNGFLLNRQMADLLIEKYRIQAFQFTIDACRNSHNSQRMLLGGAPTYDVILENFRYLVSRNTGDLDLTLRIQVLNNRPEDVEELLDSFSEQERKKFLVYFRPITKNKKYRVENANKANLESFYQEAYKRDYTISPNTFKYSFCASDGGDRNKFVVLPDLSCCKCLNRGFEESTFGLINQQSEMVIAQNRIAQWQQNNPFYDSLCKDCKFLPVCFGGCPWQSTFQHRRSCFYEKEFGVVDFFLHQKTSS